MRLTIMNEDVKRSVQALQKKGVELYGKNKFAIFGQIEVTTDGKVSEIHIGLFDEQESLVIKKIVKNRQNKD